MPTESVRQFLAYREMIDARLIEDKALTEVGKGTISRLLPPSHPQRRGWPGPLCSEIQNAFGVLRSLKLS